MEYETSVDVAAPVESVWKVLTDVERMPEWTESMTRVERLDDGPFAIGSKARVQQPKMQPMVWTVTELEPARSFTWGAASGGVRLTAGHRLTPGPSTLSGVLSVRLTGPLAPILTVVFGRRIRRYVRMEAEGLKRRCEARGTPK
ncbi:MAG: SRPBCC family protein [Streptosporangiaceae bacterium]